jgi:diaminopimelate epimerase
MFAKELGIIENETQFMTIGGKLSAEVEKNIVHLRMPDVHEIEKYGDDYVLNTGSPHYVRFTEHVKELTLETEGPAIRHNPDFKDGVNANFSEITEENSLFVRTFERGVEAETYSCGTGVTACALASSLMGLKSPVSIQTIGGQLKVSFEKDGKGGFRNIYLIGPAEKVFEGEFPGL